MKKILLSILVVFVSLTLFGCGCENLMNTPTKRVEELFSLYQKKDEKVLKQLDEILNENSASYSDEQLKDYKDLMLKQYSSISYSIKDEVIDGDNATVTVEIEVFDYANALKQSQEYYLNHQDEFMIDGSFNDSLLMDYKINAMKNVKDKAKYTLYITLSKVDKKWTLNELSQTDIQKIHGLYNS